MSVAEKSACVDGKDSNLSISRQCELLQLPRSSYYRPRLACFESVENLDLMRRIDEEFLRHPFYGSRKMRDYLNREGFPVNRKRVQRLMRLMGLESVAPKPNTSQRRKDHKVYPYLLKRMSITDPGQVWCSDITYIRMPHGFVYLTAIMDWASRYVLSWEISVTMNDDFCVNALKSALRRHQAPEIFNTDPRFWESTQTTMVHSSTTRSWHTVRIGASHSRVRVRTARMIKHGSSKRMEQSSAVSWGTTAILATSQARLWPDCLPRFDSM